MFLRMEKRGCSLTPSSIARAACVYGGVNIDPQIAEFCLDGIPYGESQAKQEVRKIAETLLAK